MADQKITALTADTSPTTDDLVVTVNDPGGTPANRKVTVGNLLKQSLVTNPYMFRAYHNTTQNSGNGAYTDMGFNTESFDIGGNFASNVFTAPITGYYLFGAGARVATVQRFSIQLVASANGPTARGSEVYDDDNHAGSGSTVVALMYLAAGDTVKVQSIANVTTTIESGSSTTYFWGQFVSL